AVRGRGSGVRRPPAGFPELMGPRRHASRAPGWPSPWAGQRAGDPSGWRGPPLSAAVRSDAPRRDHDSVTTALTPCANAPVSVTSISVKCNDLFEPYVILPTVAESAAFQGSGPRSGRP